MIDVGIEAGKRRVFSIALAWPGWARSGKDEASAIQALLNYGPRYSAVIQSTEFAFDPPDKEDRYRVVERQDGNSTTEFGAPAMPFRIDANTLEEDDLHRFKSILTASWEAFDRALLASRGMELRKGPRGGGRDQQEILSHVIMADESYLSKLGWKFPKAEAGDPADALYRAREAIMEGFEASVRGEISEKGPRGGLRWTPLYFVRRVIWHILDHTWEIEDRMEHS